MSSGDAKLSLGMLTRRARCTTCTAKKYTKIQLPVQILEWVSSRWSLAANCSGAKPKCACAFRRSILGPFDNLPVHIRSCCGCLRSILLDTRDWRHCRKRRMIGMCHSLRAFDAVTSIDDAAVRLGGCRRCLCQQHRLCRVFRHTGHTQPSREAIVRHLLPIEIFFYDRARASPKNEHERVAKSCAFRGKSRENSLHVGGACGDPSPAGRSSDSSSSRTVSPRSRECASVHGLPFNIRRRCCPTQPPAETASRPQRPGQCCSKECDTLTRLS